MEHGRFGDVNGKVDFALGTSLRLKTKSDEIGIYGLIWTFCFWTHHELDVIGLLYFFLETSDELG